ncbi:penicillin-binding protein [Sesbania bispinosa]|nr:penicillin-binding protein [Sesbania bispinosa]
MACGSHVSGGCEYARKGGGGLRSGGAHEGKGEGRAVKTTPVQRRAVEMLRVREERWRRTTPVRMEKRPAGTTGRWPRAPARRRWSCAARKLRTLLQFFLLFPFLICFSQCEK